MENKNKPAFAHDEKHEDRCGQTWTESHPGLTKREYIAAKAMHTMMFQHTPEIVAAKAVEYADELLKALDDGK